MPLQNRVTPFGEIVAQPWRGGLMGNRGCLHGKGTELGVSRWRHQAWVCCTTDYRGRQRDPMPPGRWTTLFFWDEAAALAAGHRPCGFCRRQAYAAFMAAWAAAGLPGGPGDSGPQKVDRHLHRHRVTRTRQQVRYQAPSTVLPDGTFVMVEEGAHMAMLLWQSQMYHLSLADGRYYAAGPPPDHVTVLTPEPMVRVLSAGYRPQTRL